MTRSYLILSLASTLPLVAACGGDDATGTQSMTGGANSGGGAGMGQATGTGGAQSVGVGGGNSNAGGMNAAGDVGAGGAVIIGDAAPGGDVAAPPAGTCSDKGPDPTPKAPFAKAMPLDAKFPFSTHWMGMFADNTANAHCISMTSLTDLDKDGDLDFADGQRDVACSGNTNPNAPMLWWEYCTPDHWVRHTVGTGFSSAASGGAGDFDNDGWIDLVAGNSWFKNPGAGVQTAASWMRYPTGAPGATEEIAMGDLNGDGRLDALYVVNSIDPQWWSGGTNPMMNPWTRTVLSMNRQQQGAAIADLNGDGKNDAIVGDHWWYAAPNWTPVAFATDSNAGNPAFVALGGFEPANTPAAGSAPLTMGADMDGDGDIDIAMCTHWGYNVAWMENVDGKGTAWKLHMVPNTNRPTGNVNVLHDTVADDFDNDGDIDILVAENQGNLWIYENVDGKGVTFAEHKIATGPGHEARAADVDCDGDLDLVGKSWSDPNDGRAGQSEIPGLLGYHVYYKNELVEKGGTPVFNRPKGEVWNVPNKGKCK